jgi:hypothetical protein
MTQASTNVYSSNEMISGGRPTLVRRGLVGSLLCGIVLGGALVLGGPAGLTLSSTAGPAAGIGASILAAAATEVPTCPSVTDMECTRSDWPW